MRVYIFVQGQSKGPVCQPCKFRRGIEPACALAVAFPGEDVPLCCIVALRTDMQNFDTSNPGFLRHQQARKDKTHSIHEDHI
ncbi:hypothetical protein IG631_06953 [Alternaria alternata]|nr:hypothetical protein IG631_06953 [Alternaria alternata]